MVQHILNIVRNDTFQYINSEGIYKVAFTIYFYVKDGIVSFYLCHTWKASIVPGTCRSFYIFLLKPVVKVITVESISFLLGCVSWSLTIVSGILIREHANSVK